MSRTVTLCRALAGAPLCAAFFAAPLGAQSAATDSTATSWTCDSENERFIAEVTVQQGPDGLIYVGVDGGMIVRLRPLSGGMAHPR